MVLGCLSWFRLVFHGNRLVFHGSRLVFHGSRLVFHGSRLVFMVFMVPGWFFMVLHGSRLVFHGSRSVSWFFMVFGWFQWFFKVVSWFFMVFQDSRYGDPSGAGKIWENRFFTGKMDHHGAKCTQIGAQTCQGTSRTCQNFFTFTFKAAGVTFLKDILHLLQKVLNRQFWISLACLSYLSPPPC